VKVMTLEIRAACACESMISDGFDAENLVS
jgi:hypothetical protein